MSTQIPALETKPMEMIYFCPTFDKPSGGYKVIYKHAEILSSLGISSAVFHPGSDNFECTWFNHKTRIIKERPFMTGENFIVLPETLAVHFYERCVERRLNYAIFVQNGYLLSSRVQPEDYDRLKSAYENADILMSISEDTTEMIRTAYPSIDNDRICRILPHLAQCFTTGKKEKIISFMPRKLTIHAEKVCFFLRENLPKEWKLVPIENFTESQVAETLSKSSIFLSFCDLEGFGLPPLEAALSGALVIGYTGQGAKEYFQQPNFIEIQNGDLRSFVSTTINAIRAIEDGLLFEPSFLEGIKSLQGLYGSESEIKRLLNFSLAVQQVLTKNKKAP